MTERHWKFDVQLLSDCGNTKVYLSRSVPEIHFTWDVKRPRNTLTTMLSCGQSTASCNVLRVQDRLSQTSSCSSFPDTSLEFTIFGDFFSYVTVFVCLFI